MLIFRVFDLLVSFGEALEAAQGSGAQRHTKSARTVRGT